MPEYLSAEWFDVAHALLSSDDGLADRSRGVRLVVGQTVTTDDERISWHVRFDDGRVSLHAGAADDADVTFSCDRATAEGIQTGTTSAQAAFIAGQLRVGGSLTALLEHGELFAALDDVLAPLR
jgi:alkyl sulfatase BDS1-like metallo-beta-lactamase superfamily hydrolase